MTSEEIAEAEKKAKAAEADLLAMLDAESAMSAGKKKAQRKKAKQQPKAGAEQPEVSLGLTGIKCYAHLP